MNPAEKINEATIEGVKNGDMAAFDLVYRAYSKRLYRFVYGIIKTEIDAEEIVQEVFVKIWESHEKIDNFALFDSYLFTIAYNSTISLIRKKLSEKKYIQYIKSLQIPPQQKSAEINSDFEILSEKVNELIGKFLILLFRREYIFK